MTDLERLKAEADDLFQRLGAAIDRFPGVVARGSQVEYDRAENEINDLTGRLCRAHEALGEAKGMKAKPDREIEFLDHLAAAVENGIIDAAGLVAAIREKAAEWRAPAPVREP